MLFLCLIKVGGGDLLRGHLPSFTFLVCGLVWLHLSWHFVWGGAFYINFLPAFSSLGAFQHLLRFHCSHVVVWQLVMWICRWCSSAGRVLLTYCVPIESVVDIRWRKFTQLRTCSIRWCFFCDSHVAGAPYIVCIYPVVDFLSALSAYSAI